jgi:hypothetical protein
LNKILAIFLTLNVTAAFAQQNRSESCGELPSCQVNGYSQTCQRINGTDGVTYIPGCSVVCPANKSPACVAGVIYQDCGQAPKVPECFCN